jgi:hypothetical protein
LRCGGEWETVEEEQGRGWAAGSKEEERGEGRGIGLEWFGGGVVKILLTRVKEWSRVGKKWK